MICSPSNDGAVTEEQEYIRANINDKIVPMSYCDSGPGSSCPLKEFVGHVARRKVEVGNFDEICGLDEDVGQITFLHQR
jgi:acid phosphatase